MRLTRRGFLRQVVLPGALPGFLLGLRFAVTAAWLALVVVEQINSTSGIGYMMELARTYGQTDIIVVGLVLYGLLGLLSDGAVRLIQRKALSWQARWRADARPGPHHRPDARSHRHGRGPGPRLRPEGRPQRRRPEHPRRASSSRCWAGAAPARAPCCGPWPAWTTTSPEAAASGARTRSRSSSRTRDCCRGQRCSTTSSSACAADARERGLAGARRGRARRPRAGLAARAVRRRAAAGRAGPVAGPRARAAAGRRAVRRARRADPARGCTTCCATCAASTGPRSCWSPTTSTRRSPSPTGCWCSTRAGSRSSAASSCTTPATPPVRPSPRSDASCWPHSASDVAATTHSERASA